MKVFIKNFSLLNQLNELHAPEDVLKGGGVEKLENVDDIIDALSGDDGDEDDKKDDEEDDKDKKEVIELEDEEDDKKDKKKDKKKEDEEDDEDEDKLKVEDDDDELVTPTQRKEILKVYPDIFKKFPYVEKAMYRDQQFTEHFATPKEAAEAADRVKSFEKFEGELFSGKIDSVFSELKTQDEEAFANTIDNLMPALQKTDEKAYYHVINNTIKNVIVTGIQAAKGMDKDDAETLTGALSVLHRWIYGNTEFVPPSKYGKAKSIEPDGEAAKLTKEREDFNKEKLTSHVESLDSKVTNTLRNTIDANIDPKDSMTPYVKKNAIKEVADILDKAMRSDKVYQRIKDRLWDKARENGYKQEYLDNIKKAHLSTAKTLLPGIIKKVRGEALSSNSSKKDDNDDGKNRDRTLSERPARDKSSSRTSDDKDKVKQFKGSTLDFLNQD